MEESERASEDGDGGQKNSSTKSLLCSFRFAKRWYFVCTVEEEIMRVIYEDNGSVLKALGLGYASTVNLRSLLAKVSKKNL